MDLVKKHDLAIEQERSQFLQAVLKNQILDVSVVAHEFTLWDEAINKVIFERDQEFMDENIGSYLIDTYGYTATLILTDANEKFVRFDVSEDDGQPIPHKLAENKQLQQIAQTARAVAPKSARGSGYWLKIEDDLYLVGAGAFTYEDSYEQKSESRKEVENYVLLTLTRADQVFWDKLTTQFSLPYLAWEGPVENGLKVEIKDSLGNDLSYLVISGPNNPVQSIIENYGVAVVAMTLILIGFALFSIKRSLDYKKAHDEVVTLNKHMDELVKARTDELAIALEAANEASRAKSVFLSSMSHEFRTPLNGILGFNQLLRLDKNRTLTEKEKDWISQIQAAGELLLSLVNDVLDLAHVESGRINLNMEKLQAREVFKNCCELTKQMAAEKGITLKAKPESDKLVEVDRRRLQQIILNLLNNAIKYNKEGGDVVFGCKNHGKDQIRLYIADTGYGILDEEKENIFDPFFRSDRHSSEIEGTGVGLSLVQHLTEAMGGTVSFESEEGKGTTFYLDFPAYLPNNSHT
ncbi:MAG: hypothetical protein HWE30_12620 [Methylocystaceae bacterium]|nr:hypothetical protein [Methylocystaceae bacterium]